MAIWKAFYDRTTGDRVKLEMRGNERPVISYNVLSRYKV